MNLLSRLTTRAVLTLLLILASAAPTAAQVGPLKGLDAYIEKAMQDWELPGLAIAIVKDDEVIYVRGYGVREIGKSDPVDEHTLFAIASNTKAFTATALGLLVHEGKLSWDDHVTQHLPGLQLHDPCAARELIVRDLLCHRTGFQTWAGDLIWWGSTYSREDVLHRLRFLKPAASLRSQYGYTNMMFLAAGQIIPAITDTSWDEFLKQRLIQPLGMTRTTTSVRDLQGLDNVATPHTTVDNKLVTIAYRNIDNMGPAGSMNASVMDLTRWLRLQLGHGMLDGKQLVDSTIIAETRTPHTIIRISSARRKLFPTTHFITYGLGWSMRDYHGYLLLTHGGGMDGMFSTSGFVPEAKLGVVVLTNKDMHSLDWALFLHLIDAYLGLPERDWSKVYLKRAREEELRDKEAWQRREKSRVRRTKPSAALKHYEGTYRNELYGEATVARKGRRLTLQLMAHPTVQGSLEHWQYDTFLSRWSDPMWDKSLVTFTLDADGKVATFSLKVREDFIDPLEYVFKLVP